MHSSSITTNWMRENKPPNPHKYWNFQISYWPAYYYSALHSMAKGICHSSNCVFYKWCILPLHFPILLLFRSLLDCRSLNRIPVGLIFDSGNYHHLQHIIVSSIRNCILEDSLLETFSYFVFGFFFKQHIIYIM